MTFYYITVCIGVNNKLIVLVLLVLVPQRSGVFTSEQWMGKGDDMDPEELGWVRVRNRLEPRMTDLPPPAPDALLKVVRCTCKHDCDTKAHLQETRTGLRGCMWGIQGH